MSLSGAKSRVAGSARELSLKWTETKNYWQDAKSREFEHHYLEDLFVEPAHRGKGIGKALLTHVAKVAVERKCGRFEWAVLDWNTPAINFYRSLGAVPLDDWTLFRVTGDALNKLAG